MAQKESNTVALSSQAQLDLRGREKLIVDLQENVHMLQQKLDKERSIIKEVKKQVGTSVIQTFHLLNKCFVYLSYILWLVSGNH